MTKNQTIELLEKQLPSFYSLEQVINIIKGIEEETPTLNEDKIGELLGEQIYCEHSNGFWVKMEYDSESNLIYCEDSNGLIIDKRPKPCENKVVEIEGIKYKLTKL